ANRLINRDVNVHQSDAMGNRNAITRATTKQLIDWNTESFAHGIHDCNFKRCLGVVMTTDDAVHCSMDILELADINIRQSRYEMVLDNMTCRLRRLAVARAVLSSPGL